MSRPIIGWARHRLEPRFHAVVDFGESVRTACNGCWEAQDTAEATELARWPVAACGWCWDRALEQENERRAMEAIAEAERSGVA